MKHLLRSLAMLLFIAVADCAIAQTWDQTGNAITVGSKLGSTNGLPLKFITNNVERMRLDTFGRLSLNYGSPIATLALVKKGSSLPGTVWSPTGTPMFTAFGETVGGNADFIVGMAGDAFNFRPTFMGRRSRGTLSAPAVVQNNDQLTSFATSGFDGTSFQLPAAVEFYVDGTPSAGSVPARISFVTGSNGATRAERLRVGNTGNFAFNVDQMYLKSTTGALGMGTTAPNNSSILDINSTTKGVLIPRMTMAQRNAIAAPATGLLIYQTDNDSGFHYYSSTSWKAITAPPGDYANTSLSNLAAPTAVNVHLLPATSDSMNLGDTSLRWGHLFLGGNINMDGAMYLKGNRFLSDKGNGNNFFGTNAGVSLASGLYNTATGFQSLYKTADGYSNSAFGYQALYTNTGTYNSASGYVSLYYNTSGYANNAFGAFALYSNTTGSYNTAFGADGLIGNTTGNNNTAVGIDALRNLTTTSLNTGIGYYAGDNTYSTTQGTFLGAQSRANTGLSNVTAVGYGAAATSSNQVMLGNSSVTSVVAAGSFVIYSDGRFKKDIQQNVPGLEFINKLRPVTYHYKIHDLNTFMAPEAKAEDKGVMKGGHISAADAKISEDAIAKKESKLYTGFVAQEVETAAKELNFDFSGVYKPSNPKDVYGLSYAEFVVPLVKAVQELSKQNETLKKENSDKVDALQKQIDELKAALMKVMADKAPCYSSK